MDSLRMKRQNTEKALLRAGVVWRMLALSTIFVRQFTSDSPRGIENPMIVCLSQW